MPLPGRPIEGAGARHDLDERDWILFDGARVLYAFTPHGARRIASRRLDPVRKRLPQGCYVALPEGFLRTPYRTLEQLQERLPACAEFASRGLVANTALAQVFRSHETPPQLGFLVSGEDAVPGGEWLFVAEGRVRAVTAALGFPVRRRRRGRGVLTAGGASQRAERPAIPAEKGSRFDGREAEENPGGAGARAAEGEECEMGGHVFAPAAGGGRHVRIEIPEGGLSIVRGSDGGLVIRPGRERGALAVVVAIEGRGREAALVTDGSDALLVNGQRTLEVQVLGERDEIALAGGQRERLYYGSRRATGVVAFSEAPERGGQARCARCKKIFEPEDRVIACPGCSALHHEGADAAGEELACWTHDAACGACRREREGLCWSPEESERDAEKEGEPNDG